MEEKQIEEETKQQVERIARIKVANETQKDYVIAVVTRLDSIKVDKWEGGIEAAKAIVNDYVTRYGYPDHGLMENASASWESKMEDEPFDAEFDDE